MTLPPGGGFADGRASTLAPGMGDWHNKQYHPRIACSFASGNEMGSYLVNGNNKENGDIDVAEIKEWLDSLEGVLQTGGTDRARFLLTELESKAYRSGVEIPFSAKTPYINNIPSDRQAAYTGSRVIVRRINILLRRIAKA